MPFTSPLIPEPLNANNTGDYAGYAIRVKGDGRVQAIDPEGNTTMHNNVLNAKAWIDNRPETPPEPPPEAVHLPAETLTEEEYDPTTGGTTTVVIARKTT